MRPIDGDSLKRHVKAECNPYGKPTIGFEDGCKVLDMIDNEPTIQPEQRYAEWVETEPDEEDRKIGIEFSIKCSGCHEENAHLSFNENHEITGKTFWKSRFCPNCGAKMRDRG